MKSYGMYSLCLASLAQPYFCESHSCGCMKQLFIIFIAVYYCTLRIQKHFWNGTLKISSPIKAMRTLLKIVKIKFFRRLEINQRFTAI